MRLPSYQPGQVQRLTPKTTASQESAAAQSNLQTTRALTDNAVRLINETLDHRDTVEELQAKETMATREKEVDALLAQDDIPVDQLDAIGVTYDDITQDIARVDGKETGTVKNYKVRQRVFEAMMTSALENASEGFSDGRLRDVFKGQGKINIDTGLGRQMVIARNESEVAQNAMARESADAAIEMLDADAFRDAISYMSPGAARDNAERMGYKQIQNGQVTRALNMDYSDPNRLKTLRIVEANISKDVLGDAYDKAQERVVREIYFQEGLDVYRDGYLNQGKWRDDYADSALAIKNKAEREEHQRALNLIPLKPKGRAATAKLFQIFGQNVADLRREALSIRPEDSPQRWAEVDQKRKDLENLLVQRAVDMNLNLDDTQLKEISGTLNTAVSPDSMRGTPPFIQDYTTGLGALSPSEQLGRIKEIQEYYPLMAKEDQENILALKRDAEDAIEKRRETYAAAVGENNLVKQSWDMFKEADEPDDRRDKAIDRAMKESLIQKTAAGFLDSPAFRNQNAAIQKQAQQQVVKILTAKYKSAHPIFGTKSMSLSEIYADIPSPEQKTRFANNLMIGFKGMKNFDGATTIGSVIRAAYSDAMDDKEEEPISIMTE